MVIIMDTSKDNLYGLILTGGKSSRMKRDKAMLNYHGVDQIKYCSDLLKKYCGSVFLSNREDQKDTEGYKGYQQIHDRKPYVDIGPLGGILSAMTLYPDVNWLILACDLPYVDQSLVEILLKKRDPLNIVTAFKSAHDDLPEPLFAIYESTSINTLKNSFEKGINCPRKILLNSTIDLLELPNIQALDNINNPEEFEITKRSLKNRDIK